MMSRSTVQPGKQRNVPDRQKDLGRVSYDVLSHKLQMTMAVPLILLVCFLNYHSTLHMGLLLDDFLHVDQALRFLHGDWHDFLLNLYSNWGGSDLMRSYRPLVSLSVLMDAFIFHTNVWGYHFTNLILHAACAMAVSMVTLELTGMFGNRLGAYPAIWAGLLFAVYPLHPEASAWMIGRVDLLCTLFYLLSVFCFLRYRLLRQRFRLGVTLTFALLALLSKEMAVTLPVVLSMCALLPVDDMSNRNCPWRGRLHDLRASSIFWVALFVFAALRSTLIGATIGGYGGGDWHALLAEASRNFADRGSWLKLLFPFNEEVIRGKELFAVLSVAYGTLLLAFLPRFLNRKTGLSVFLFLLAWMAVGVLPTFQIWHIYPNLVGSRLFFLSSAPFCMFLALAAIPALDALPRAVSRPLTIFGALILVVIMGAWSFTLQLNLKPWLQASKLMAGLEQQLVLMSSALSPGQRILLVDLPADYMGAGMVTRPQYLNIALGPLFQHGKGYEKVYDTLVAKGSVDRDAVSIDALNKYLSDPAVRQMLRWNPKEGKFTAWTKPDGDRAVEISFAGENAPNTVTPLLPMTLMPDDRWHASRTDRPSAQVVDGQLQVIIPAQTTRQTYPVLFPVNLNPLQCQRFEIEGRGSGKKPLEQVCTLVWQSADAPALGETELRRLSDNRYEAVPGGKGTWFLNGKITQLGLRLSQSPYSFCLRRLRSR